jgi:hypothetical protein
MTAGCLFVPRRRGNVTRKISIVCRSVEISLTAALCKSITSVVALSTAMTGWFVDAPIVKELELEWD